MGLLEANEQLVLAIVKAQADTDAANRLLDEATRSVHLDALTGLPDRILFLDRLAQALTNAQRHKTRLALLFVDVDQFKKINDSFGHATGDEVLRVIAKALVSRVRKGDTVSRHGGDEFLVLLNEVASAQDAVGIAVKLGESIEASRDIFGDLVHLKVSIGVSVFPEDGQNAASLIARADAAMYRVKSARRGVRLAADADKGQEEVAEAGLARRLSVVRTADDERDIRNEQLRDANERLIVAVLDAQATQIAAQSGQPYRALIDRMGEGAVTLDERGAVLFSSETFARMVGLRSVDLVGVDFSRLLAIEAEAEAFLETLARGPGAGSSSDILLRGAGGTSIPVRMLLMEFSLLGGGSSARVICGIVADRRIESRTTEVELLDRRLSSAIADRSKSEERLELALEAAGMGSWELDLDSGTLWCAQRSDRIFGRLLLPPDATLRDMLEQVIPEDRRLVQRAFDEAVESGLLDIEFHIKRPDTAAIRWLHFKAKAFHEFGRPVRISGVVSDVSHRRSVEDQLRQAQKMEAVGQLTGGIAHDFNNLLLVIGGSLDLLARRLPPDERTARLIDTARKGVDRGARLNQQLLAFSRRQELRPEVLCMDDLVPAFGDLAERAVGQLVALRIVPPKGCWFCEADRNQLETAILNLVINARDAMPDGGTLTIAAENRTLGGTEAATRGAKSGDYCVVSVADTGIGMTREVISRVFEPFFTTKPIGLGTGLGLSQTYGFAKQSDGFVAIESEPGVGTRISIFLPRSPVTVAAPSAPRVTAVSIGQDSGSVLVVDDEAEVRATTSAMLRDLGYTVHEADSALGALALFDAGLRVDVVFSDVIMPGGMNGKRLAAEILSRNPSQVVLLTSGFTGALAENEPGGRPFPTLKKPYSLGELASTVRAAVDAAADAGRASTGR